MAVRSVLCSLLENIWLIILTVDSLKERTLRRTDSTSGLFQFAVDIDGPPLKGGLAFRKARVNRNCMIGPRRGSQWWHDKAKSSH